MDEALYDAIIGLKKTIDEQNEISGEILAVLRALVGATQDNSQELAELREVMTKN